MADRTEIVDHRPHSRDVWLPGILAGVVGAVAMGLVAMLVSAAGPGFWAPMKLIAATWLGREALVGDVGPIVLGMGMHLLVGALYGVIFAAILPRGVGAGADIIAGLVYGAVVFFVMTFLVMPWANPLMYANINFGLFFLYHLVFGLGVSLVPPLRRTIEAGTARTPGEVY